MHVIACGRIRRQRHRILAQGAVRRREIRRAAEQLGQRGTESIQGRLRRLTRGQRLALGLCPSDIGIHEVGETAGQIAPHAPLQLGGQRGEFGFVGRKTRTPFLLHARTLIAHVPGRSNLRRYLERWRSPPQVQPGGGDFFIAHGFAVHGSRALFVRRSPADGRLRANQRRPPRFRARRGQRGRDGIAVLAVHIALHMPAVGLEARRGIVAEPTHHLAVDGYAVVVVHRDELAELLHAGK